MSNIIKIHRGLEEAQEAAQKELADVLEAFKERGGTAFAFAMVLPDGIYSTTWYNSPNTSIILQAATSMLNFRVHKEALTDAENDNS